MSTKTDLRSANIASARQLLERSGYVVEQTPLTIPVNVSERDGDAEKSRALLAQLQGRAGVDVPARVREQGARQHAVNARYLANAAR